MASPPIGAVKQRIGIEAAALHQRLRELSHLLHGDPELGLREFRAAARLTAELERHRFAVERGVAGMETAFVASYGSGDPVVAFLAEYDALPEIGHACGHNLIATWAVGAGIALRNAVPDVRGTIKVIGTPAEENVGGKVAMTGAGVFAGVAAAMMIHGADRTILNQGTTAMTRYTAEFHSRSPSALDALLQVFFAVNQMRATLPTTARVHGAITDGGTSAHVVPERAVAEFQLREEDDARLEAMRHRFRDIVEGAALATGARAVLTEGTAYKRRIPNNALVATFAGNADRLGVAYEDPTPELASSDSGNVSHEVPTVHPYLQIAPRGTDAHTPAFAIAAASELADRQIVTGATLLACTAVDVLFSQTVRDALLRTFRDQLGKDPA